MRLTADLINNSLSYLNPLKERELDLRGHKIPGIENLGVAGQQDAIDFTDNDLTTLSNFPLSPRLNTLLCARNRIQTVDKKLADAVPNLITLMLANNNVRELADIEGLTRCTRLSHLVLSENPVTKREHYRAYMIWSMPSIRFLDHRRVRDIERDQAKDLFGTQAEPTELALQIRGVKSKTFDTGTSKPATASGSTAFRAVLSATEKKRVQEMLQNAKSMAEIDRIEKDLAEGRVPRGAADADRMNS